VLYTHSPKMLGPSLNNQFNFFLNQKNGKKGASL
jgi:hypothetical protein